MRFRFQRRNQRGYRGISVLKTIELKCWPRFFREIWVGHKTFEVRKVKKGFAVGRWINLKEFCPAFTLYSGREIDLKVTYILTHDEYRGISPGYCVMGFERITLRGVWDDVKVPPVPKYCRTYWVCRGNACGAVFVNSQGIVADCAPIFKKKMKGQYFRFFQDDKRFKIKEI